MRAYSWFLRFLSWFPLPVIHAFAWPAGQLLCLAGSRRDVARINLSLCFPQLSEAERSTIVRQSLHEFVKPVFESAASWYWPVEKIASMVTKVHALELLQQAREDGSGVVLAVPHFGAWEWCSVYLPKLIPDNDLMYLYKPSDDAKVDDFIHGTRARSGGRPIPANPSGLRTLLRGLKQGEVAAVLPDQRPQNGGGEFAPFYGIPALTQTLIPKLVQRTGCKVIFMVLRRLPRGRGFELHFLPAHDAIYSSSRTEALAALNRGVEDCIALDPKQYLWAYKRFGQRHREPRYYD